MNMTVGIEHFPPYIKFCSEHGLYDKLLNLDLSLVNSLPFSDREFDVATCIEVLEHLPKQSGIKILKEIERVARKVVITTPRSPHAERWNLENYKFTLNPELFDNNPNMIHQSKWTLKEFKKQGYKVHGYGNFGLRKVGFVLQGCSWIIPRLAENYLCEKETSE
jgi:SAM-dependent methyltransferase